MGSRYLKGPVQQPELCLLTPPPHYRMLRPQRTDFHVSPSYVASPQQPPNQTASQGPQLRGMAPTGPPTQASTSPNTDLKVQPHVQQSVMNIYAPPRGQNFFSRGPPPNPAPHMMNQQRPPQAIFSQTQMMPYHTVVNVPTMAQNFMAPRATSYMPQFYQTQMTSYPPPPYQMNSPSYFVNQPSLSRPQPAQVAPVASGFTHTPQAQPMAAATLPGMQKKPTKKRSRAIPIINPETMRPLDDEESHPTSGESSARQTPQPAPINSAKEVQATFAKQVAQAINTDVVQDMETMESHHHSAVPDVTNVTIPPQQPPPQLQQQQQLPPPQLQHQPAPFQQIPPNVYRNDIVKSSKLQVPTNDFVPANNLSNTAKEPPVVSAISNSVEVTIPGKPKDRESPAKGRKAREPPTSSSTVQKESTVHKEIAKESVAIPQVPKEVAMPQEVVKSSLKEEKQVKESSPVVQAATEVASKAPPPKEQSPVSQAPPVRDDKKQQPQQHQQQAKKTENWQTAESGVAPIEIASVNAPQPQAVNQDNSGKSKQNQRGKEQQSKQAGGQQTGQNNKPPAPTVAQNQQQQQPSKSNKASKMKELNMKGASKEGTDMDAFNMNVETVANTQNSTEQQQPPVIQQQQQPPPPSQSPPQTQMATIDPLLVLPKKIENNEPMTITKPEPKPVPKRVTNITDIVKDTPKPFTPPPVVDNKDETDRAPISNDKLVQAKNEVNAKTAISNEQAEIKPLQYKENQWSPHNQEGKKVYDRDFLMALRTYPHSKSKPDNILNDILAFDDRSKIGDLGRIGSAMGNRADFTPSFGTSNFLGKSQSTRIAPKRNSQQGKPSGNSKGGKSGSMIRVCISFKEDVKLHETENAWKPARLSNSVQKTDDDRKTEDLYRKVRGVLNKLTPQKFNTLLNQIKQLPIDSSERLQGVIDLVFEKAVDEPNFSVAYALMCRELALMQVPVSADSKDYVNFRKLLVTRCQIEFEKNSSEESNRNERSKIIDECTDPEKKKELMIQLEEDDRRIRQKSVGNIRFIGELFKQAMLTTKIMACCLENLIENEDEERLECLCKLLTTIGKDFEQKHKMDVTKIFDQMRNIVERKNGKVSSRVRFMLQDVIDLRAAGWIPRRTDLNPKTIDQIQKEADNEQLNIQMNTSQMTPRKDDRNSSSNSERKRGGRNMTDDGWISSSRKNSTFNVQSEKFKIQQPSADEPLGSRQMFGSWQRGSNIKPAPAAATTASNKFAALESVNDMDTRPFISSRHKEPYSSKSSSMERSFKTYDGRNSRSGSQQRTQDNSQRNTPTPTPPPQKAAPAPVQEVLNKAQLARRIMTITDEYISDCAKIEETEHEFRISIPTSAHVQFVTDVICAKLERSGTARTKVATLFSHLIKNQALSLDNYCAGLEAVFALTDDLIVDIPQLWVFYAESITNTIITNMLPLSNLQKCGDCLIKKGYAHRLLAAIFALVIQEKGPKLLSSIWQDSGLKFEDFMDAKEVDGFISKNRLEFLTGSGPVAGQSNLTYTQIYDKLKEFVQYKNSTDDVFQWITANVGEREKEKEFIRVLSTVYIENSIVNQKLNEELFRSYYTVFQRYISSNIELELQCLYAIQSIVNQLDHPQGLLLKIFNTLYEDSIISYDCFLRWEKSEDPIAQENKGVAVLQLTSFFTQLKEVDSDSGSSLED